MGTTDGIQLRTDIDTIREEALEFAGIGLFKYFPDGIVEFMDKGAMKIFDIEDIYPDASYITGKNISELVPDTDPENLFTEEISKHVFLRDFEYSFKTVRGTEKWVLHDSYLVIDQKTGKKSIQVIIRDITEHKATDEGSENTRGKAQKYFDLVGVITVVISTGGKITFINKRGCEVLGYGQKEIIGKNWFETFVPEEFRDEVRNAFKLFLAKEKESVEYFKAPIINKAGENRVIKWNNIVLKDNDGSIIGTLSSGEDITEEERAGALLEESEEKIRAISDSAQDAVIMMNNAGNVSYWNKAAKSIFGYSKEEVIGKNLHKILAPERFHKDHFSAYKKFQKTGKGLVVGKTLELVALRKGGEEFPIELSLSVVKLQGKWNAIGILRDITKRKKAEEESKNNYQYQLAFNSLLQISLENISLKESLERSLDVILSIPWLKTLSKGSIFLVEAEPGVLILKAHKGIDQASIAKCKRVPFGKFLCGKAAMTGQVEFANHKASKDGNCFVDTSPHEHFAVPIISDDKVIGIINLLLESGSSCDEHDITFLAFLEAVASTLAGLIQRKHVEEALQRTEQRCRGLVETARDVIFTFSTDGTISSLNPVFETVTGWTREEWLGKPFVSLVHPEDSAMAIKTFQHILKGKTPPVCETRILTNEGNYLVGEFMITPRIQNEKIVGVSGIGRDISERKQVEEEKQKLWYQLLQSQKLEPVGRLAGGIAHDFNNVLSTVIGYNDLAMMELPEGHPVKEKLKIVEDAGEKAVALIQQLLAFSRKQVLEMKVNNINTVVDNIAKMLVRMIGEDVRLKLNTKVPVKNVMIDSGQIEQVLMNLAVNAKDAMPQGGTITIDTADAELDDAYVKSHQGSRSGSFVKLSVADTGSGMDKEVLKKIFQPFFTTKEQGKGTGLGLSTAFGIIKQHNGYVWVESEIGKGTAFEIYLPVAEGEVKEIKKEAPAKMQKGVETVLLVDDDTSIRRLIIDTLTPLGYKLLEAASGEEALRLSDVVKEKIDVMLTDVIMTGMDGWELYETIKGKRPEMKVIFTSGYMDNAIVHHKILGHGIPFIKKPLRPHILVNKMREVLSDK